MFLKGENLSLIYDMGNSEETYALRNISIEIEKNRFYGILGPSGSGKSSLLYILSGLKKPNSGDVSFNGKSLNNINEYEASKIRMNSFGFIFQRHFLIDYLTSLQNVLVPLNSNKKEDVEKAKELLCELGLEKQMYKKPYQMSGGQRQRVAIARALIKEPEIIFADEITASLDHKNAFEVMEKLIKYKKNSTIVCVTHDPSIVEEADETIKMWDGSIKEIEKR
jgi:putative ABC transport system ATP-binding protein